MAPKLGGAKPCRVGGKQARASDRKSPFEAWFVDLDATAMAKVTVALAQLEHGNTSSLKPQGGREGVLECRIDFGPGYRVYLGRDGETLVILLTGGTKKRQQRDIDAAQAMWTEYRRRKPTKRGGE
ncbi:type II toxin-antitoxin system RelE/ParE family toxin [Lichenicoccus roseus]|uniref:Type II toxin-antitoxin system RelE/ParE family toxin n=1 Tax=Lichenicoccus roseus TaxID=2683649 RepID=A0A5R9IYX1_9PROT|nr:type II toxin-antitoxin system RelE/ParE family toxin [Lichenicoccus roseus]